MVRTPSGQCHLLYSCWPRELGFDAWATHAQIAVATADHPGGPFQRRGLALPARGAKYWDGHSVYNPCLLYSNGLYYLYYTGNRGAASWRPDRALTMKDEDWWTQRNNQRVGVAVAPDPGGPWTREDTPLIDTGGVNGTGITAVPNVIARPDGRFLMVYKTLAPGPGRFGGGVVHYPALADHPLGPFRRCGEPIVDKRKLLKAGHHFNFHIDDHLEWWQNGRYYGLVKDHDAPFLTSHGRALLLIESADGISWRLAAKPHVLDFALKWESGEEEMFERLEMPKLYLEDGAPHTLYLAAKSKSRPEANSFLVAIPLRRSG